MLRLIQIFKYKSNLITYLMQKSIFSDFRKKYILCINIFNSQNLILYQISIDTIYKRNTNIYLRKAIRSAFNLNLMKKNVTD